MTLNNYHVGDSLDIPYLHRSDELWQDASYNLGETLAEIDNKMRTEELRYA